MWVPKYNKFNLCLLFAYVFLLSALSTHIALENRRSQLSESFIGQTDAETAFHWKVDHDDGQVTPVVKELLVIEEQPSENHIGMNFHLKIVKDGDDSAPAVNEFPVNEEPPLEIPIGLDFHWKVDNDGDDSAPVVEDTDTKIEKTEVTPFAFHIHQSKADSDLSQLERRQTVDFVDPEKKSPLPPVPACAHAMSCLQNASHGYAGDNRCGDDFRGTELPKAEDLRCYCRYDRFLWRFKQCVNITSNCAGREVDVKKSMDFMAEVCKGAGLYVNPERLYNMKSSVGRIRVCAAIPVAFLAGLFAFIIVIRPL